MPSDPDSPPSRVLPSASWQHLKLYDNVKASLAALPAHFRTETYISGVMAPDIHTLNTALGATIEEQVVSTLNAMRGVWDPEDQYALYSFVRQPQVFPDVLLKRLSDGDIILGIELKGWYLLAREQEPSFRYQVTASCCSPQDLIVVVPWTLANVISGSPVVFDPYMESARYAAAYRNHHWTKLRDASGDRSIKSPSGVAPYPKKSEQIQDVPASDKGGNFGRFARTGIMDAYLQGMRTRLLCGIRVDHWLAFLKVFQVDAKEAEIRKAVDALTKEVGAMRPKSTQSEAALVILSELRRLLGLDE